MSAAAHDPSDNWSAQRHRTREAIVGAFVEPASTHLCGSSADGRC